MSPGRLNDPDLPQEALDGAFRKIARADGSSLIERNRAVSVASVAAYKFTARQLGHLR